MNGNCLKNETWSSSKLHSKKPNSRTVAKSYLYIFGCFSGMQRGLQRTATATQELLIQIQLIFNDLSFYTYLFVLLLRKWYSDFCLLARLTNYLDITIQIF